MGSGARVCLFFHLSRDFTSAFYSGVIDARAPLGPSLPHVNKLFLDTLGSNELRDLICSLTVQGPPRQIVRFP